ncbi:MAG: DUF6464 family protein [Nostoc sp. ChiSLP01]
MKNIALKIEKIITIIAQSFELKKVFVAKISDKLWCFNFYWQVANQILDFQYMIYEITLCDSRTESIADVICYEIRELIYCIPIGDSSCKFNAQSPKLRCAINPSGPCEDCDYYEN